MADKLDHRLASSWDRSVSVSRMEILAIVFPVLTLTVRFHHAARILGDCTCNICTTILEGEQAWL